MNARERKRGEGEEAMAAFIFYMFQYDFLSISKDVRMDDILFCISSISQLGTFLRFLYLSMILKGV